jgi:tetratricopeptide (TPR) repeat protein
LSGIDVTADGNELIARSGGARWNAESHQLLLDFQLEPAPTLAPVSLRPQQPEDLQDAEAWYLLGCELEDVDAPRAIDAYRRAIGLEPYHAEALINLGRLQHAAGDLKAAELRFREALRVRGGAVACFNLGVALEDQGRVLEALEAYEKAIAADPECEDAYFNAARLFERTGQRTRALQCLKRYRSLLKRR